MENRQYTAANNQVFVACAARTMKTQFNETVPRVQKFYYGDCDEKRYFSGVVLVSFQGTVTCVFFDRFVLFFFLWFIIPLFDKTLQFNRFLYLQSIRNPKFRKDEQEKKFSNARNFVKNIYPPVCNVENLIYLCIRNLEFSICRKHKI